MKLTRFQQAQLRWERDPAAGRRSGFWITLLIQIALFVAVELLRPKPEIENAKPSGLGDFRFPTATEGRVVPIFWGTVRMDGPNVVWYGDLRQEAITEKVKTGLFSSQQVTTGFKYYFGIQFGLSLGEVDELRGLWIGDDRVFTGSVTPGNTFTINNPELFGGEEHGSGGFVGTFRFYGGDNTQTASSYLSTFQQQGGDTPAYRGICYVANASARAYVGNSTSIKPWKFEVRRIPNGLGLGGGIELVNGADANPANVLYDIMTNKDWGLGYDPSDIDTANFAVAAATLATENSGMSYMVTSAIEASALVRTVEEQIDGLVRFNQSSKKWEIKLARADYTPGVQVEINEDNMVELVNYSRGAWEGTANQVRVQFTDRNDDYKTTYALAQDTANVRIQDVNVSVTKNYPGVMDRGVANNLAWRDLRSLSYPLAKASVVVDRTFWDFLPGDVVEFTHAFLGLNRLPMRIIKIGFGELENNRIRLDLVQDVFYTASPSFSDPTATGWEDPEETLAAFPVAQQEAFEAPRAIVRRDPVTGGILINTLMAAARQSGTAISFDIRERHAAGTPTGVYAVTGNVVSFLKIGQLNAALSTKSAYPLSTLLVSSTPDNQADIIDAFAAITGPEEMGTLLMNLVLVDDEFMLVTSAIASGGNVSLVDVYRGVLDSVQADHSSAADVFILQAGANTSEDSLPETDNVDIKLIPIGFTTELAEASANTIQLTMDKRIRRPYPPALLTLNTVDWDTTAVNMEGNGSAAEDYNIATAISRRDYRTADGLDEIAALQEDAGTTFGDFPAANSTDHDIEVRHDPTGSNDLVLTASFSGTTYALNRIDVLDGLAGAVPTGDLQINLVASHTDGGETLTSRQTLVHAFAVTTALTGQFEFGQLAQNVTSALYTATVAGTYAFTQSSVFTVGLVQYRLNGGAWTTLIPNGSTTGNIAGVVGTDTIEVRHTSSDASILKQLDLNAPGAGQNGFAIFN